ncbi:MAG TPA: hypothetical protein VI793_05060 [Anaerolineales bacterium]|nr:hypothetical protein [Anaerolineales bacterium]
MNPEQAPFPAGWYGFELQGYRECDATYCLFPYASLPPLDASLLRGEFEWLADLADHLQQVMGGYRPPQENQERLSSNLNRLTAEATQTGLKLPVAFLKFMGAPYLQDRMPSCTACYFDLSERIIESSAGDGGYLIRFLNDQQDVLLWYLYLNSQGDHCVLVSPIFFDEPPGDLTPERIRNHTFFCAPSFEAFIFRFWLENHIWFALEEGALIGEQRRYLSHYRSRDSTHPSHGL